jgi:tetratricopeptide (TPR) repeat protein
MPAGDRPAAAHLSAEDLRQFLLGTLDHGSVQALLAHLFRGCAECAAPLAAALYPPPPSSDGSEYEFPIRRAFRAFYREVTRRRAAAAPPAPARELYAAMLPPLPPGGKRAWRHCEALLEESWRMRYDDPEQMLWLAVVAVAAAETIDPALCGPRALADLQARARAALGNARRVRDDLHAAEADLLAALERSGAGTGDPLVLAEILERLGIVFRYERRFEDARRVLGVALHLYEREDRRHEAGVVLMHMGLAAMYEPASRVAVDLFLAALQRLDPERDPKVIAACLHNLAWTWADCGELEEARDLASRSRKLFADDPDPLIQAKIVWLDGRIAAGFGRFGHPERCFQEARETFRARKLPYTAAVVALDLAALWLERGRRAEARDLVRETIATFGILHIEREAIMAVLLLSHAVREDCLTAAILRSAAVDLQKVERSESSRRPAGPDS